VCRDFGVSRKTGYMRTAPGPLSYISPYDWDEVTEAIRPPLRLLLENSLHDAGADAELDAVTFGS
jgi:hypothetical protein